MSRIPANLNIPQAKIWLRRVQPSMPQLKTISFDFPLGKVLGLILVITTAAAAILQAHAVGRLGELAAVLVFWLMFHVAMAGISRKTPKEPGQFHFDIRRINSDSYLSHLYRSVQGSAKKLPQL